MCVRPLICLTIVAFLAACSDFPELDTSELSLAGAYPRLLSVAELQAMQANARTAEEDMRILEIRAANLRARAERLKAPVLSAADRARLLRGMGA